MPTREVTSGADTRGDEELLAEIASSRSHAAFTALFHRHEREAYNLARYVTDSADLAESAVQAALLRVWLYAGSFKTGDVRKWMMTIVAREAIKQAKARRRAAAELRDDMQPLKEATRSPIDTETALALRAAIEQLPAVERQVVTLHYSAELPLEEIGSALQLSRQLVSYRLKKALEKMRGYLVRAGFAGAVPVLDGGNWIGGVLQNGPAAPAGLYESCLKLLDAPPPPGFGRSAIRASRRAAQTSAGNSALVLAAFAAAAVAAGAYFATRPAPAPSSLPQKSPPSQATAVPEKQPFVLPKGPRKWVFDRPEAAENLGVITGGWKFVPATPDTPAHMLVNPGKTHILIGVSVDPPVKVRIRAAMCLPQEPDGWCAVADWVFWTKHVELAAIHPKQSVPVGAFVEKIDFVSERYLQEYVGGKPVGFYFSERMPGSPLMIVFHGAQKVTELEIADIKESELPDPNPWCKYIERATKEQLQRECIIPIPDLESKRPPQGVELKITPPNLPKEWPPRSLFQ